MLAAQNEIRERLMLIGYARVSTHEPNLPAQLHALRAVGCERVFSDKTGRPRATREALSEAISHTRSGDVLVVWKLDRLGQSMQGLVSLAADLTHRNVGLRSITDGIDTAGTFGKPVVHLLAALAEMERDLHLERFAAVAQRPRISGDRRTVMTPTLLAAARKLVASGMAIREIAPAIGVSVPTLYRHLPASVLKVLKSGKLAPS
jgi:DNA invertase Pin-like site-specific DNA recombinase